MLNNKNYTILLIDFIKSAWDGRNKKNIFKLEISDIFLFYFVSEEVTNDTLKVANKISNMKSSLFLQVIKIYTYTFHYP